jgi:hypothetical protein
MDPDDFSNASPGRVLRTPKGYMGFIPNPLPPTIGWSTSLISALGEAERNLGRLASLADTLHSPHILGGTGADTLWSHRARWKHMRMKADPGLQRTFGRRGCAEQSVVQVSNIMNQGYSTGATERLVIRKNVLY